MTKRFAIFILLSIAISAGLLQWDQHRGANTLQGTNIVTEQTDAVQTTQKDPTPSAEQLRAKQESVKLRMEKRISQLDQENEALRGQMTDLLNWILTNVRGRYPVREQDLGHLKLPVINEDFELDDSLSDFLKLSTDEIFLVEDAFQFTRAKLRVLQDANMEWIQDTPNQIVMNIQSFPESGSQLKKDLDQALEASIGQDRLERLQTVSNDTLKETFDHFGQASRTLIFEMRNNPATGQPSLVINDAWFDEQNPDQLVYTESEIAVEALPEKYRDFEIYLTENFSPVTRP